ncbi:MAG: hypothetical protein WC022_04460, partial [Parcubacteria group bacterium]
MKNNLKNKIAIFFSVAVVAVECFGLFFSTSAAQVAVSGNASPRQIETTAYIVNSENKEIANGEYDVKFSIYPINRTDANSELGTPLWQETQKAQIQNGIMDAFLGSVTPLPTTLNFGSGEYYLGITIGTDEEMIPRKKIGAVPLAIDALNAQNAQSIQGATVGMAAGNILQLGANGKVNIKNLPTGTSGNTLVLSSDKRLKSKITISGRSYIKASGLKLTLDQINLGADVTGTLSLENGGTGIASMQIGDVLYYSSGNALNTLPIGAEGEVLTVTGGVPAWQSSGTGGLVDGTGVAGEVAYWSDANTLAHESQLSVSRGGTGTNGSAAANGTLLIGNGSGYSLANLTQGSNIIVTNGSGSITIATSATPSFTTINGNTISAGAGTLNLGGFTLALTGSSNINQNLLTTSSPIFSGMTTNGNILAGTGAENIGSVTTRFNYGYFTNLDVQNLTIGGVDISGTISNVLTINSDNTTNDTEDSYMAFDRGENGGVPNPDALIMWDATNKYFDFNFGINVNGVVSATGGNSTNWNTAYTNRITSATSPLSISSNAISISQANTTTSGYLSNTDW